MTFALLAGVALLLAGTLGAAAGGVRSGLVLQAGGAALVAVAGALALDGHGAGDAFAGGIGLRVGVDALSGAFLLLVGVVGAASCLHASATVPASGRGRAIAALTGLFVLALAGLVCARDVVSFLGAWEAMTILPASMVLVHRPDAEARRIVFVYVALTHICGAGVWLALLLLEQVGGLGATPSAAGTTAERTAILVLALVGFGTKAGMAPFHVWLPREHPIAPAHAAALMSGAMVGVALYGLIRVAIDWVASPPAWFAYAVLGLGALSALGGVLYALFQRDLRRLLAYSTIENVGIMLIGLGAALLLRGDPAGATWSRLALAAVLLHALAHGLAKSLLFLVAGSIDRAVRELELDRLGGLLARMPWTGGAMLLGAAGLAGLPPLAGFASEWLSLQAVAHVVLDGGGVLAGVVAAVALVALALTGGLAVVVVVQACGLALLGPPRSDACRDAVETPRAARAALALLGIGLVALAALAGPVVDRLARIWPPAPGAAEPAGLDLPGTGSLRPLAIGLVVAIAAVLLHRLRGGRVAAPAPTWVCGQRVEPALRWSGAGFSKPLRLILEVVLRPRREVRLRMRGGVPQEIVYRGEVPNLVDAVLYRPAEQGALRAAALARRLQGGSLGAYVGFLGALVVLLLLLARTGAL